MDIYIYILDYIGIKFDNLMINFNVKIIYCWINWIIELVILWVIFVYEVIKKLDIFVEWVYVWNFFILNLFFVFFVIDLRWFVEVKNMKFK